MSNGFASNPAARQNVLFCAAIAQQAPILVGAPDRRIAAASATVD
jgi:hypothetical protein